MSLFQEAPPMKIIPAIDKYVNLDICKLFTLCPGTFTLENLFHLQTNKYLKIEFFIYIYIYIYI